MEFELVCENCGLKWTPSKSVYYRRLKEEKILCRSCHTNKIGKFSEKVQLGKEKAKRTCLEKYGVDNPAKSKIVQEKSKKTNIERYGCEWQIASAKTKEKITKSNLKNHGVTCTFKDPSQKEKTKKTLLEKYGVDNAAKSLAAKEKMLNTRFSRNGTFMPAPRYRYNDIVFDSSWELAFYIFYTDRGKTVERCSEYLEYSGHKYFPDFKMDSVFYEIKGNQFFKNGKFVDPYHHNDSLAQTKWECMLENQVHILREKDCQVFLEYVKSTYGKDFLKSFRC